MLGCNKIYTNTPLNGYHCTEGRYIIRGNVTQGFYTLACLKSQQCAAMIDCQNKHTKTSMMLL